MKTVSAILFFLAFFFSQNICASEFRPGDFLLVEKPENLSLFNKYKQTLSPKEKENLLPFEPFLIKKIDESDPLQLMLETERFGEKIYIALSGKNALANAQKLGEIKLLKNYTPVSNVKINRGQISAVSFFSFAEKRTKTVKFSEETKTKLIARKNTRYLVKINNEYGIVKLKRQQVTHVSVEKKFEPLSPEILQKINGMFVSINKKLDSIYVVLNGKNDSVNKNPPHFKKISDYEYKFENGSLDNFARIKNYLVSKINLLLLTRNYEAIIKNNSVFINKKTPSR